jgi:hypothetical protein
MTRWLWTAPDGSTTDLSDWSAGTYVLDDGTSGELAPDYEFATQPYAGVDGENLTDISVGARTTTLGMDFVASDGEELRQRIRRLAHVLRPRRGIGALTAVADDGTQRRLPCYYAKGLDSGVYRVTRYRTALEFWAPSPWWRGEPVAVDWALAAPAPFFPIPPVRLSATTIGGAATVDLSDCDAPTYARFTVTGPGSQLTLRRQYDLTDEDGQTRRVSQTLVLNAPIGDGQVVTVDMRPGRQAVTRDDGTNLFGFLGTNPAMWQLVDGVNDVSALLTNAGPASRVALTAERLYSGAR